MKNIKIIFILSFLLSIKNLFAVNIPKDLDITDSIKQDIEKISKLKIDKKFSSFVYDAEFAKQAELDIKKAVKLPENMHGAGISVVEYKPETDKRFAEYNCKIHFILKNKDDYWLPKDSYGSWFDVRNIRDGVEELTGADNAQYGHIVQDYSMRSFIDKSFKQSLPNNQIMGGSLILSKYLKNIYSDMTYVEYYQSCAFFPEIDKGISVWLEKTHGPNFKIQTATPLFSKFFYELKIPNKILLNSCKYIQKSAALRDWNLALQMSDSGIPNSIRLKKVKDIYNCKQ